MAARSIRLLPAAPTRVAILMVAMGATLLPAPLPSRAGPVEPARVRVAAALIDDVVRGFLPVDLVLPGPSGGSADGGVPSLSIAALLTELRYCGATDKGVGRFRAVIRWGPGAGRASAVLGGDEGCRQTLTDLARQLPAAAAPDDGAGVSVADLDAAWRPWELRLVVARMVGPAPPRPGPPRPLAGLEGRKDLLSLTTAGFRVPTDTGETLILHVAPSFVADGIELLAVLGDKGSGPPSGRPPSSGTGAALSGEVNVAVDLPYAFANQILRQLTGVQPLAIPIDRDVIDLQYATITGAGGGVMLTGIATPRSVRESARLTVQAGGAELRVTSVRADAQIENCAALGVLAAIGCNARNAARNAAAAAFGAAMTNKYQGQLVRELAGPQVLRFDVAGRRLELPGDLLHLGAPGRGLSVSARFSSGVADH